MDKSIYVALSGAVLHEKRMEILTDSIANVNTPGYKKQKAVFEEALAEGTGLRTFAMLDDVVTDMSQGVAERTGRKLDAALNGNGFFVLNTPEGPRYTRDGSFTISTNGILMSKDGYPVMGNNGTIKLTSADVAMDAEGNIKDGDAVAGKLKVVTFDDTRSLVRIGSLFAAPAGMVEKQAGPLTQVEQGVIEMSNVSAVKAMTSMIEAMRSYESHTKMIQTIDDMTKKAIEEVGRVA